MNRQATPIGNETTVKCPKEKDTYLESGELVAGLPSCVCKSCGGTWLRSQHYEAWRATQSIPADMPDTSDQEIPCTPAPTDSRAGLCPECGSYLSRVKVGWQYPFYVERCAACGGIWCDRGEWDSLQAMNLHTAIPQLFSMQWQFTAREKQQMHSERQALSAKLGEPLAQEVISLADKLENSEYGDFAVAYLIRRFERERLNK